MIRWNKFRSHVCLGAHPKKLIKTKTEDSQKTCAHLKRDWKENENLFNIWGWWLQNQCPTVCMYIQYFLICIFSRWWWWFYVCIPLIFASMSLWCAYIKKFYLIFLSFCQKFSVIGKFAFSEASPEINSEYMYLNVHFIYMCRKILTYIYINFSDATHLTFRSSKCFWPIPLCAPSYNKTHFNAYIWENNH